MVEIIEINCLYIIIYKDDNRIEKLYIYILLRMLPGIFFPEPGELAASGRSLSLPRKLINKYEDTELRLTPERADVPRYALYFYPEL